VSGAQFVSRPFLSAASTIVDACASVTTDMAAPLLTGHFSARLAQ
jgi:hypothetical protein